MKKQLKISRMNTQGQYDFVFERKVRRILLEKLMVVSKMGIRKILLHVWFFKKDLWYFLMIF